MTLKEHRKQVLSIKEAKTCIFSIEAYVIPDLNIIYIQFKKIMRYAFLQYGIA